MSYTKQILLLLILAIGLTGFFGCTKSKTSTPATSTPTPTGTGKPFYVKLDGLAFVPAGGGRYYVLSSPATGIQIVGDDATTTVELHLSAATVGTYTLGAATTSNFASVFYTSGSSEFTSTSGEVKITKSDGSKISGTFSYTAVGVAGTVQVTVGEFNDIPKQ